MAMAVATGPIHVMAESITRTEMVMFKKLISAQTLGHFVDLDCAFQVDLKDVIDENIVRVPKGFEVRDHRSNKSLSSLPADTWQDDHSRVDVDACGKSTKVPSILSYNNQVFFGAAIKDLLVRISEASVVAGMNQVVLPFGKQVERELW